MRFFYRETTETGKWRKISREKAEAEIAATYGEESQILKSIKAGTPFNCTTFDGQIKSEK
jgi:hypothetical protein